jgi:hypothetical protein
MELVVMARQRLTFIITWGMLFLSSQILLLILFSAIGYDPTAVAISETVAGIFTAMMTAMMMVREDIDGKEIFRKE